MLRVGAEKLPPIWFWGSTQSPSVAPLTSSLPQHCTAAPLEASFFQGLASTQGPATSKQSLSDKLPLITPVIFWYCWTKLSDSLSINGYWTFFLFTVTVLGEKKAKQISLRLCPLPLLGKRTDEATKRGVFCVASFAWREKPQQSVASYRCCYCTVSLGALVQLKGIFTQKVLLVPGSQRHANLLAHN
jgi:hypothetical protein